MTSPYSIYSADISVIAQLLIDKLNGHAGAFVIPLTGVVYGDQNLVPSTPYVTVEPDTKTRELAGAPNMTENTFQIFITVLITNVSDTLVTRKQADQLAYDIEKYIHGDLQLTNGGPTPALIHGYVTENTSGVVIKGNTKYQAARLTFTGKNKTSLATT